MLIQRLNIMKPLQKRLARSTEKERESHQCSGQEHACWWDSYFVTIQSHTNLHSVNEGKLPSSNFANGVLNSLPYFLLPVYIDRIEGGFLTKLSYQPETLSLIIFQLNPGKDVYPSQRFKGLRIDIQIMVLQLQISYRLPGILTGT